MNVCCECQRHALLRGSRLSVSCATAACPVTSAGFGGGVSGGTSSGVSVGGSNGISRPLPGGSLTGTSSGVCGGLSGMGWGGSSGGGFGGDMCSGKRLWSVMSECTICPFCSTSYSLLLSSFLRQPIEKKWALFSRWVQTRFESRRRAAATEQALCAIPEPISGRPPKRPPSHRKNFPRVSRIIFRPAASRHPRNRLQ